MKRTSIKIALILAMIFTCFSVFAEGSSETPEAVSSATTAYEEEINNPIIIEYLKKLDSYNSERETLYAQLQLAYDKNDAKAYVETRNAIINLSYPQLTEDESKIVEAEVVKTNNIDLAKQLFAYSRYYHPVITFTSESTGFSYKSSISVEPGSKVTVPELRTNNKTQVFKGWSTDGTNVLYEAGSEIDMPLADLTLYAVFEKNPDLVEGCSSEIKSMKINGVETLEIPRNQQFDFSFVVKNNGTENLENISVTFDSDDPLLVVLTDTLSSRYIESCGERTANYKVITKASSGTKLKGLITVKDSNNNVWTKDVELIVK